MEHPTDPLRTDHRRLAPEIERIRAVADSLDDDPREVRERRLDGVVAFLTRDLMPHAQAEEAGLYQVAGIVLGSPDAMAGMSRDHVEIGRLTDRLVALRDRLHRGADVDVHELRRVLYGLHAIIALHVAKEEEIFLPLLDEHLTKEEADSMIELMAEAERFAKTSARTPSL